MNRMSGWRAEKVDGVWCARTPFVTIRCATEADARQAVKSFETEYRKGQVSVICAIAKAADAPEPYALP